MAGQLLALYDCPPWRESYIKHKEKEGKAIQEISETSTSILIGATPESARFNALETCDAMRWRFSYYVSERFGRMITWPPSYDACELSKLATELEALKSLKGEMRLSREAFELWGELARENRRQIEDASRRFQKYKSGPKRETAIDDDGLASNHRCPHTQEYNYISYVLRRAGALQKGAVD